MSETKKRTKLTEAEMYPTLFASGFLLGKGIDPMTASPETIEKALVATDKYIKSKTSLLKKVRL